MDSEEFLDAELGPNEPKEIGFAFEISLVTKGDSTVVLCFDLSKVVEVCISALACLGVFSLRRISSLFTISFARYSYLVSLRISRKSW